MMRINSSSSRYTEHILYILPRYIFWRLGCWEIASTMFMAPALDKLVLRTSSNLSSLNPFNASLNMFVVSSELRSHPST